MHEHDFGRCVEMHGTVRNDDVQHELSHGTLAGGRFATLENSNKIQDPLAAGLRNHTNEAREAEWRGSDRFES